MVSRRGEAGVPRILHRSRGASGSGTLPGAGGTQLGASQLDDLQADLDARRDPNRPLVVRGYKPLALSITVKLIAISPDRDPKDVKAYANYHVIKEASEARVQLHDGTSCVRRQAHEPLLQSVPE